MAIIISDNFNRANSTTTLGNTPVGNKPWQKYGTQQWGITSNTAYPVTADYDQATYVDAGISDNMAYQIKIANKQSTSQIMYRLMSDGNGYGIESNALYKIISNNWTKVGDVSYVTGDVIRVELRGDEHKIFVNGTLRLTYNDTYAMTGTKFGFSTQNVGTRFDDFQIETIDPPVQTSTNLYLTENLADNTYVFPFTAGTNTWTWVSGAAPNGNSGHLASATIGHDGTSSCSFAITVPAADKHGKLEVDYAVSSEVGYDFFKIDQNGTEVFSASGEQQGTASLPLAPGSHTITFRYVKDGSTVAGSDKAYVSELRLYADTVANPVKTGELRIKHPSRTIIIPIYDIAGFTTEALRVRTVDGTGFIPLVLTTDPKASAIRLQTTKGLRALKLP